MSNKCFLVAVSVVSFTGKPTRSPEIRVQYKGNALDKGMANKNPVMTAEFIARHSPKYPDDPLSDKAIAIRFKTSMDKKLRTIPEYSVLVRDCVDKYFDDLTNPHPVESLFSTDEPINLADYGLLASKPAFVRLPQKADKVWQKLGSKDRAEVLRMGAIREMKSRGLL